MEACNETMEKIYSQRILRGVTILIVPLIIFTIINLSTGINAINQMIRKGTGSLPFIFIPFILLTLAYQRKGWLKYVYAVSFLSLFYALLLKWYWTTGYSNTTHLWGYLPTSDSGIYYQEALGLLSGNPLDDIATFRPIFTLFYSSLLWISSLNPMISLWFMGYLNVLGSLVASNEVHKTHGSVAAALYLTCGFLFYKFWIGTIMTEQLGFLLANLAFACFWSGIQSNSIKKVLVGLFILSMGLNVRAGAMIILLILPIWIGFHFGGKAFSYKFTVVALLISLSGFAINSIISNIFVNDNEPLFSNFGLTLYGVAVGNKGYTQFYLDHPGISIGYSTQIAIQHILSDPLLFLRGVGNTYRDYFNPATCGAFCYLRLDSTPKYFIVFVLFILGSVYVIKNWKKPFPFFLIFAMVGILISIPFAPTRDVGYRSYTITNPILTSFLFIAFLWIEQLWIRFRKKPLEMQFSDRGMVADQESIFLLTYPLLSVVFILALIVPIFVYKFKPLLQSPLRQTCAANEISVSFFTNRDAWIHVVPQENLPMGISIPYGTIDTLTKIVTKAPYHRARGFTDSVQHANPGNSIGYVPYYYMGTSTDPLFRQVLLVINTSDLPQKTGLIQICGKDVTTKIIGNQISTFIATNLHPDNTTVHTTFYKPWIEKISPNLLITMVAIILIDSIYSQFSRKKILQI